MGVKAEAQAPTLEMVAARAGVSRATVSRVVNGSPKVKPELITAVNAAKGRTSDNLGTKYPKISEPLWNAVQAALSGSKSPQQAMSEAQGQTGS